MCSSFDCVAHLWVVDQQPARKERNVKHFFRKPRRLCNYFITVNEIEIV